jgi:hypothetical protein
VTSIPLRGAPQGHLGGLDAMVRWKGGVKRTMYQVLTHLGLTHPPGWIALAPDPLYE